MIFLLYRSSIPFARWIFGTAKAANYIGQQVTVEGWYRRGLTPYVEMSRLTAEAGPAGTAKSSRLYSRWIQSAAAAACFAIGWLWYTGAL